VDLIIGMSVFYFLNKFPKSKIVAIEANPFTYKLLEKNIKQNNVTNVDIFNNALYDSEGEISFFIDNNLGTLRGSIYNDHTRNNEMKVKCLKLSNIINNYSDVDLVKMDIEGAEINVINELFESKTLTKVKQFIIEYHHKTLETSNNLSEFLKLFENSGYKYSVTASYDGVEYMQDIMIHFYK